MQKRNIHTLARAVIIQDNNILLCKTADSNEVFYFLPGGHIEDKESAEDALLRELKEETGLSSRNYTMSIWIK